MAFGDYEEERPRRLRSTLGCVLPIVMLAALGGAGYYGYQRVMDAIGNNTCKVTDGRFDYQWSTEQTANAATIALVGRYDEGLPERAAQIAAATSIQESKLRNLRSGDRDSLGLFQQRPSQGWGTAEQIQDPIYASKAFYRALVKIPDWQTRTLTEVAQEVQRSGYPQAYADHETQGRVIASVFSGGQPGGVGCRMDPPTGPGSVSRVVAKLADASGLRATGSGGYVTYRGDNAQVWAVASWAVAHAQAENITSVVVGDRAWNRDRGRSAWTWTTADNPTRAGEVRLELAR
ncbi:hypothetical protein G9U51_04620 [Calidifontibacter sp. DB0510]|uniref:Heavy metal transporter n=1 Tax=Metallococcus carri TaxID=1656884 RepID=A0A967B0B6_9MICO|nr:hypothetical protein [Metallococcus carri]NHN55070.1 hypothetical protein [Metallococcus carri]NOP36147.1 hypothetical protein [Calidifontibacter sp. DB2511S]